MTFPTVPLGRLIRRSQQHVDLAPTETYKQITVKLHHLGVVLRGTKLGSEIGASRQFRARAGQLIVSRIDARNGALGLIPTDLDNAVVTNDFWLFDINENQVLPGFLDFYVGTREFAELCQRSSEGTTNRVRLRQDAFLDLPIPSPSISEQLRILERVNAIVAKINELHSNQRLVSSDYGSLLDAVFSRVISEARWLPLGEVAPLIRRPVVVDPTATYEEIGVRSFGKGVFHKAPVQGHQLGSKRVFRVHPGDLVFSNVFAWEGAVAVVPRESAGRIGSHRFITCTPHEHLATGQFIRFHFLTLHGLQQLKDASPGGAGRNRTLGLAALRKLPVPVPSIEAQIWFDALQERVREVSEIRPSEQEAIDALLPSILNLAFRDEL